MAPKKYVTLLPAPHTQSSESTDVTSHSAAPVDLPKKKRIVVPVACNMCRVKKTRCNGVKPSCGPCVKRGSECVYLVKKDVSIETAEVLGILQNGEEKLALGALRMLRAGVDPAIIMSLLKNESEGRDPSPPFEYLPYQSDLEIELAMNNPVSYPTLDFMESSTLEQSNLLRPAKSAAVKSDEDLPNIHTNPNSPAKSPSEQGDELESKTMGSYDADPDSAVQLFRLSHGLAQPDTDLCDERLNSLKVQFWTTVPVSSTFAAKILSLYLKTDHPLLGTFDADLFVHDLVNQQQRYCSSFLVNCVLYWGCQMYSAIDKTANDYAYRFCDEAERLWEVEKRSDSILNMAGIQMLSLAYIGHGKDHYVLQYLSAAVQMGKRLGLLGVDRSTATRELSKIPEGLHQAHAFAAWGIFNWTVLMSIFYQQPGLEYPKFPPMLPIPGASDAENSYTPSAGAIFQLRNELPQYMGNTFTALCGFWRIMHEVSLEYYSNGQDLISDRIKIEFAEMKYREILAWAETLPQSLARRPNCPHHVLTFHMWLHSAILDIFRPFIKLDDYKQLRLRTFSAVACSPDMAYRASVKQLKHLIVQYRSNYESSLYTILWHTALTYVANAVIVDPEDTQWRLYFLLCLYGYEALRRPFRISEAIGRGLLTMSLRYRDVNSEDARRILEQLKDRGLNHVKGDIRATFMGDLGLAMTNPMEAKVESLANDFDDMALFREFTHSSEEVNHPIAN